MRKLAVITGGTKGIGKALVMRFAREGFDVITCSRREAELGQLKADVEAKHGTACTIFPADLSKREEVAAFAAFVSAAKRPVAVLVNNVGFFLPGAITTEEEGNLERMMAANVYSAYHLTRALVPEMLVQKSGHIFNMCSIASFTAYPSGGSYAITKFALLGFSKCLREELKPVGIRVTAVMPGATFTDSWSGTTLPEERFMAADDVAEMVFSAFSLSARSVVEDIVIRPQLGDL